MPLTSETIRASWRRTLDGIPTLAGRLAYLASLRDADTGLYQHFGLSQKVGEQKCDFVLRESHAEIFQRWLCLKLEEQRGDVAEYLRASENDPKEVISNWLRLQPYRNWMPADARDTERRLFLTDLGAVSELIRTELGVASPDLDL